MSYDVLALIIRAIALALSVTYAIKTIRSSQHRRSVTSTLVVVGSLALVYGGLSSLGIVDGSAARVLYTAVAVGIIITDLTLLTVDE